MKVINRTYCGEQNAYLMEYCAKDTTSLPSSGIAYGSIAICEDGIYSFFEDDGWVKII